MNSLPSEIKDSLPAYTLAAVFTALFIVDLIYRKWTVVPGHIIVGILSVILLIYICKEKGPTLGWILLSIPFVFILLGSLLSMNKTDSKKQTDISGSSTTLNNITATVDDDGCICLCCWHSPCKCTIPCKDKPNSGPGSTNPCIKPTLQS